jgi:hypothetical protein
MPNDCGKAVTNMATMEAVRTTAMLDMEISGFFNAFDGEGLSAFLTDSTARTISWVLSKYESSPALVLGVGFALAIPAVATIGAIFHMLFRRHQPVSSFVPSTVRTKPASIWRQSASLESTDSRADRHQIDSALVRIGRETDNDLCLSDPSVHRYHAILERTPDAEFYLSYLGDPGTEGLYVNGKPIQRERLRGGEVLQIGSIKLRFALGPA